LDVQVVCIYNIMKGYIYLVLNMLDNFNENDILVESVVAAVEGHIGNQCTK
jgi:hypothetical protein